MAQADAVLEAILSVLTTLDQPLVEAEGMMDRLNIRLLRNLAVASVSEKNPYVEIGVFRGLSLVSVATAVAPATAIGIDNFSQFDQEGSNQAAAFKALAANGLTNARVINDDFEAAIDGLLNEGLRGQVGLFFIDAAHDYRSQLVALLKARDLVKVNGVLVVDDANYAHVRQSTKDFIDHFPEFALVFEAYTPAAPMNLSEDERVKVRNGWGNGVHVLHHDPEGRWQRQSPPTIGKDLFEADHDVMRHGLAAIAIDILTLSDELAACEADPGLLVAAQRLRARILQHRSENPRIFPHRNTYSDGLLAERVAELA